MTYEQPWKCDGRDVRTEWGNELVCRIEEGPEALKCAALIAKAPEMLRNLKAMDTVLSYIKVSTESQPYFARIQKQVTEMILKVDGAA